MDPSFPQRPGAEITLDAAIEEYLAVISRTRPWTKAAEEELLHEWSDWAFVRHVGDTPLGADLSLALAFARERRLSSPRRAELMRIAAAVLATARRG